MKVLLVNPLSGYQVGSMPLGVGYLAAYLETQGHQVVFQDRVPTFYRNNRDLALVDRETRVAAEALRPDWIGITMTTAQVYDTYHVARLLRRVPGASHAAIVLGGYHPTTEPELTLRECAEADIAVRGEGEFTFADLAAGLAHSSVPGITYRNEGQILSTPDRPLHDKLDDFLPPPRRLYDAGFYYRRKADVLSGWYVKAATLMTSRGCPKRCKFCAAEVILPRVRFHSVEYVLAELEGILRHYDVEVISFIDIMFISRWSRTDELCRRLIAEKLNRRLRWGASITADSITKDKLALMKAAGCRYLNFGFETGSQRMLDLMNKRVKVEKNHNAARWAEELGLMCNSAFLMGLPGETEADLELTAQFLQRYNIFSTGINIMAPLPGSTYYREFMDTGVLTYTPELWQIIGAVFHDNSTRDDIPVFSDIPRDRLFQLVDRINDEIINPMNARNYLRANWRRDPRGALRHATYLLSRSPWIRNAATRRIARALRALRRGPTPPPPAPIPARGYHPNDSGIA
ncbi:MAG: radical SAM protein [candidate division NC10 bacterium]|nr:radical SAM protein [candidate division NC10 bacterium]